MLPAPSHCVVTSIQALYLHVPFCHTICPFCAFAVHGNRTALHRPYLDALRDEIALRGKTHGTPASAVRAVYIGGGTPSTLALDDVAHMLQSLRRNFKLAPDAEIAFEVNPEDALPEYLAGLLALGINRISLGLQSFDGATLAALGRGHDAGQSRAAAEALQSAGPDNFNLDLLHGAPGIGGEAFRRDVQAASDLRPAHLSLYILDVEPGTLFARNPQVRQWAATHREAQGEAFLWASDFLTARGYRHYEVSNYCLPGREGRQNLLVWEGANYLGFGTGAHSHVDGMRWHNHRHLRPYLRCLEKGQAPDHYRESLTPAQRANEALMLALRRDTGIDVAQWERTYGFLWGSRRERIAHRLVQEHKARRDGSRLALTPQGFLLADGITEQLMVES